MLAVHRDRRRRKVGTAIVSFLALYMPDFGIPVFWVGRGNTAGQQFLLANGLLPTAINSNGALRYCSQTPEEEDGEDTMVMARPRPDRRYAEQPTTDDIGVAYDTRWLDVSVS